VLLTKAYYEATRSRGSRQVDCKCNEIALSHYPENDSAVLDV